MLNLDSTKELRPWQQEMVERTTRGDVDNTVVACPGAGKTVAALTTAAKLLLEGGIGQVIVVVPTAHLRHQWATAAAAQGIELDFLFRNQNGGVSSDYHGTVVTYATVASQPQVFRKLVSNMPTLVIFDEIHHASDGDASKWGQALRLAFGEASRRLMLSGTLFRSDRMAIPFVDYDAQGFCVPSYSYDYGQAIRDGGVVRPIEFLAHDGPVGWRNAGASSSTTLTQASDVELGKALAAALSHNGDWIPSVLRKADEELTRQRAEMPDAGGLVIASDMAAAQAYARRLASISGQEPVVVTSDDDGASQKITAFRDSHQRWLVAVRMVSEGVDIPRLLVGVYGTNYRTKLFLRQMVGRFVRKRGITDESSATLFIPSIQPLLQFAAEIERTVDDALAAPVEPPDVLPPGDGPPDQPPWIPKVYDYTSGVATHYSTILAGVQYPDSELRRAEECMQSAPNLPGNVTVAQVCELIRVATSAVAVAPQAKPVAPVVLRAEENMKLRLRVNRLVSQYSNKTGEKHSHIHTRLNRECNNSNIHVATTDDLKRRLQLLFQWMDG